MKVVCFAIKISRRIVSIYGNWWLEHIFWLAASESHNFAWACHMGPIPVPKEVKSHRATLTQKIECFLQDIVDGLICLLLVPCWQRHLGGNDKPYYVSKKVLVFDNPKQCKRLWRYGYIECCWCLHPVIMSQPPDGVWLFFSHETSSNRLPGHWVNWLIRVYIYNLYII